MGFLARARVIKNNQSQHVSHVRFFRLIMQLQLEVITKLSHKEPDCMNEAVNIL